jgi:transposase
MLIIGVDYHPSFQHIAFVDTDTGESAERRLVHSTGEAEAFYRELHKANFKVRAGIEATGHTRWFEDLLAELGFELWIGDPSRIRAQRVRKQKTDRQDAQLLLKLLIENRFPRIWVPDKENRNLRQLLWHRHRLVEIRTRVMNQLQSIAMNEGIRRKKGLWSQAGRAQLESLPLASWSSRRRQDLLQLLDQLNPLIEELKTQIVKEAEKKPEVQLLMTHPGVGPITGLAFVLIIGNPERFRCGKQIGSYLGLIPSEDSSAGHQKLGHISKQGNWLLRFLLIEATHGAVRLDPDWRRHFLHLAMRRGRSIAKVMVARKLAVRLFWMWRKGWTYEQVLKFGSHAEQPELHHGVN